MFVTAGGVAIDEMGSNKPLCNVDHEIFQLTNLKSGPNERLHQLMPGKQKLHVSPVKMLTGREGNYSGRGRFSSADHCHMLSRYLPVNGHLLIEQMTSWTYVSQFSTDGSLFVAGFQCSNIRIYNVDRGWKVQKNILAKNLRWTVTDTSLSPDQCYLVYTSMSPIVHIVNFGSGTTESHPNITEIHEGLDFSAADDGGDNSIYVYDLEANKLSLRIVAHTADANTVTFADESGNLIYSGSDDNLCKVWDRRCFVAKDKPAGVLMGHLEGITFLDNRGDGPVQGLGIMNGITDGWTTHRPPQARDVKHPCDQSVTGAQVAVLKHHTSPVRDCGWHPNYPMVSSSWDGDLVKWGFPGNGKAPASMSKKRIRRRFYY
ncbi:hypothetical protein REPUB_Repub12eG0125300 [Reevesia pubescens]